jgi:2-methylcitrate dehydratase PrpD
MMGTTERVAKFIVDFDYEAIPSKGIEQTKASIIDSLGTALLGCKEPVGNIVTHFVRSKGGEQQARLWGTGARTSLLDATLANSVFIHAIDYDDGGGFGHHGAILVPPALALGEKYKFSGKKIIETYAAAYEVGYKLLRSLGEVQFGAGFHSTSLLGTICAAAESAKLLDLDVTKTRMALSIAASLSSGLLQSFGTHAKPLQVGRAAQSGLLSALLAGEGLTGDPNIFEESRGYFYVYGQEQSTIRQMTENIGKPLSIAEQDMHFKQWPCCGGNYEVLTALFDLLKEHDIQPDQIREILVATSMRPPGPVNRPHPRNGMEGRFSLPYNVATALIDQVIDLSSFSDEKFARPAVHDLMRKVNVVWHPECADKPLRLQSESRFITIDIVFNDGRLLSKRQNAGNRKQLNVEEVYEKYVSSARIAGISENNINQAVTLAKTLEKCEDVTELIDLVCGS